MPPCLHVACHLSTFEGLSSLFCTLPQRVLSLRSPTVRQMETRRPGAWQMCVNCTLGYWHTKQHELVISLHWLQHWPTELKSTGLMQQMRARRHWYRLC